MRWILVLPWRARNLCGCRISGESKNLRCEKLLPYSALRESPDFKEQLIKMATSALKNKKQQLRLDKSPDPPIDDTEIWYYRFSKEECKGKTHIEEVLPPALIDPLNEYLSFRTRLTAANRFENLLVNSRGEKLTTQTLYCLLCEITLQRGGKRLSTKTFRDIFANNYLQTRREYSALKDLSRILWHTNTITTRRYYATQYNLGALTDCVETYLKQRGSPVGDTTEYGLTVVVVIVLGMLIIFELIRGCEAFLSNIKTMLHH
jgi:hypothetical protein